MRWVAMAATLVCLMPLFVFMLCAMAALFLVRSVGAVWLLFIEKEKR